MLAFARPFLRRRASPGAAGARASKVVAGARAAARNAINGLGRPIAGRWCSFDGRRGRPPIGADRGRLQSALAAAPGPARRAYGPALKLAGSILSESTCRGARSS